MSTDADSTIEEAAERIAASRCPLLVGHVRADLDCVGSLSALALALQGADRQPTIAIQPALVPPRLLRLYEWSGVSPVERPDVAAHDLVIALDTAITSRLNVACGIEGLSDRPIVTIDHHETNEHFGRWNHVDARASSTCELVYGVLQHLDWPITPMIATLLYAGIHGDTDGFSLPNTTPRSLRVASALADTGARIVEVCERAHRSKTRGEFELLRLIYRNTRASKDGRVAWSTASHEEILAAGCNHADIDDQVSVPRLLEGAEIAILFSEGLPGSVRINIRGEGGVAVLPLAKEFGGGGHRNSAGTSIKNRPFAEVVEEVVGRAVEYLEEGYPRLEGDRP